MKENKLREILEKFAYTDPINFSKGDIDFAIRVLRGLEDKEGIEDELEKCPECGNTIDKGACYYCKMD